MDIVVETYVSGQSFFPTEKTLRPIIAQTPFIVMGPKGYLANLRRMGFMTFGQWWDESYDNIANDDQRHRTVSQLVIDVAKEYGTTAGFDAVTEQKFEHNYRTFFDVPRMTQIFVNEIVGDIQKFLAQ